MTELRVEPLPIRHLFGTYALPAVQTVLIIGGATIAVYVTIAIIKHRRPLWWGIGATIPPFAFFFIAEVVRQIVKKNIGSRYAAFDIQAQTELAIILNTVFRVAFFTMSVITPVLIFIFYRQGAISEKEEDRVARINDLLMQGYILYRQKKFEDARVSLRKGLNLDPDNPRLLLAMKVVMSKLGAANAQYTMLDSLRHNLNMILHRPGASNRPKKNNIEEQ